MPAEKDLKWLSKINFGINLMKMIKFKPPKCLLIPNFMIIDISQPYFKINFWLF